MTDNKKYKYAVGRRKTSMATVRLFEGAGENMVNEKKASEVFSMLQQQKRFNMPFETTGVSGKYHFTAVVKGGGITGQLDAIVLGVSRALVKEDADFKPLLRKAGLLTRDERATERKKAGLRKARKSPQYSKR